MVTLFTFFFSLILRLFQLSFRVKVYGEKQAIDEVFEKTGQKSFIFAIWHQNTILGLLMGRRFPLIVIVSQSKDGELISKVNHFLGARSVRGSSSKGGKEAKDQLIGALKKGEGHGAITVDGPRGPIHIPKPGVVDIARQSGVPIIPFIPVAEKCWVFTKSWDQFRMPKPFSKVAVVFGKPIWVPKETKYEQFAYYKDLLKSELEKIEEEVQF